MHVCLREKNPSDGSLVCSQTPLKRSDTHYPALIMQWIWLWLKFTSKSLIIMSQVRGFHGDVLLWRTVDIAHIRLDEKSYPLLIHKDISGLQVLIYYDPTEQKFVYSTARTQAFHFHCTCLLEHALHFNQFDLKIINHASLLLFLILEQNFKNLL